MIDQNNFIFYESGILNICGVEESSGRKSKYGGMWQYLAEHDGINWDNDHPSTKGHKIWGNLLNKELTKRKII